MINASPTPNSRSEPDPVDGVVVVAAATPEPAVDEVLVCDDVLDEPAVPVLAELVLAELVLAELDDVPAVLDVVVPLPPPAVVVVVVVTVTVLGSPADVEVTVDVTVVVCVEVFVDAVSVVVVSTPVLVIVVTIVDVTVIVLKIVDVAVVVVFLVDVSVSVPVLVTVVPGVPVVCVVTDVLHVLPPSPSPPLAETSPMPRSPPMLRMPAPALSSSESSSVVHGLQPSPSSSSSPVPSVCVDAREDVACDVVQMSLVPDFDSHNATPFDAASSPESDPSQSVPSVPEVVSLK